MAITYGFFNSLDGDRVYNADQMSEYFQGLISNGVCQNYGAAMVVTADGSGMTVSVGSGRAYINSKWIKLDNSEELTITNSHVTLNRYTAVCVHLDAGNRLIELLTIDGTPATNPTRPIITNTSTDIYLVLAYVYVGAGVTSIDQSNVTDARSNTSVCGWVSGLIDQVDTETLFLQWETVYNAAVADMQAWELETKTQFDAWFDSLTEELNINTYVEDYSKRVTLSTGTATTINLDMTGYTYTDGDIINVYINGLLGVSGTDYTLNTSGSVPQVTPVPVKIGTEIDIIVYKSRIGFQS